MEPQFDRFDIASAYWCISIDFNPCERIDRRLKQMKFKPGQILWNDGYKALSDNAKLIYKKWVDEKLPAICANDKLYQNEVALRRKELKLR